MLDVYMEQEIKQEPPEDPLDISNITFKSIKLEPEIKRLKRNVEPEELYKTPIEKQLIEPPLSQKTRGRIKQQPVSKKAVIKPKNSPQSKIITKCKESQTQAPVRQSAPVNGPSTSCSQRDSAVTEGEVLNLNDVLDECDLGSDTEFSPVQIEDVEPDHGVMYFTSLHVPRRVWSAIDQQLNEHEYTQLAKEFEKDDDADTMLLPADYRVFNWSSDFATFTGKREEFKGPAGPQHVFNVPYDSFTAIWNLQIMTLIANKTNDYAQHRIARSNQHDKQWADTNADEIYIIFALFAIIKWRTDCDIYFNNNLFAIPLLKNVMTSHRFKELVKYLHFVDNSTLSKLKGDELKVAKLKPIAEHCNKKFEALYLPYQKIAIEDSMPLYVGQHMDDYAHAKLTGLGKRIFECCDLLTGYVWRLLVHTGRCRDESGVRNVADRSYAANVILKLTEGIHGRGHTLFIDNCLNNPALARFLKRSGMDVVGPVHLARRHIPQDLKQFQEDPDEQRVSRHCGDLSINSWVDIVRLRYYNDYNRVINVLSTFHTNWPVPAGANKPAALTYYDSNFNAVDRRDDNFYERQSDNDINTKWYMQAFVRILNASLWNAFLLYVMNGNNKRMSFTEYKSALFRNIMEVHVSENITMEWQNVKRLSEGSHYPCTVQSLTDKGKINRDSEWRCARCKLRGVLKKVEFACDYCETALCIGSCFKEYHTLENLL